MLLMRGQAAWPRYPGSARGATQEHLVAETRKCTFRITQAFA
jgi:hypothetical protein